MGVQYAQPRPLPPGSTLRFSVVAEDGRRSADWRLWTSKRDPDFYAAERTSAGDIKISFHKSGDWRLAYTNAVKQRYGLHDRLLHRWRRPASFADGWTQGPSFVFPDAELRHSVVVQAASKPISAVPAVGSGDVIFVRLFIEDDSAQRPLKIENARPVGILELPDQSLIHVVAVREVLPTAWRDTFSSQLSEAYAVQARLPRHGVEVPRILVYGDVDGEPWLVELATDAPRPAAGGPTQYRP